MAAENDMVPKTIGCFWGQVIDFGDTTARHFQCRPSSGRLTSTR